MVVRDMLDDEWNEVGVVPMEEDDELDIDEDERVKGDTDVMEEEKCALETDVAICEDDGGETRYR